MDILKKTLYKIYINYRLINTDTATLLVIRE